MFGKKNEAQILQIMGCDVQIGFGGVSWGVNMCMHAK
jgi:hypothetical protein